MASRNTVFKKIIHPLATRAVHNSDLASPIRFVDSEPRPAGTVPLRVSTRLVSIAGVTIVASASGCASVPPPMCQTGFQTGLFADISWEAPIRFVDAKPLNAVDDIVRYDIYLDENRTTPIATTPASQRRCRLELEPGPHTLVMTAVGPEGTSDFSNRVEATPSAQ